MISALKKQLPQLAGKNVEGLEIDSADDFQYLDPVDSSESKEQGVRVFFSNGGGVVIRLSGTGTQGATLRVYFDTYVRETESLELDPQEALAPLVIAAEKLLGIKKYTGRTKPDVVT